MEYAYPHLKITVLRNRDLPPFLSIKERLEQLYLNLGWLPITLETYVQLLRLASFDRQTKC